MDDQNLIAPSKIQLRALIDGVKNFYNDNKVKLHSINVLWRETKIGTNEKYRSQLKPDHKSLELAGCHQRDIMEKVVPTH